MKKTLFTLALLAGLGSAAQAQRNYYGSPAFGGLKAGGSFSNLDGNSVSGYRGIYGFHLGAVVNVALNKTFSLQPELLYSQKGGKVTIYTGEVATNRYHYLDLPVALRGQLSNFFAEVGPQLSMLLAARETLGGNATKITSDYALLDLGYVLGVGYQPQTGLGAGLRFNAPFASSAKAIETPSGNAKYKDDIKHSVVQVYVSYMLKNTR
ncbi:hypothetical protein GCM10023185_35200 [Hymenobacter saemangeumensis]|uniref:Outer membrane protein beta-barrel domain-containing protein n=1 Tax=Hymenobacter saemangeumensis TaxID=1084522 RepID=A0ABP8IPW3_9BACT